MDHTPSAEMRCLPQPGTEREQAGPRSCWGVPAHEQRGALGLPGEELTPPLRVQGPGIRMPPQEQIGKIWGCGSPVEGDLLRTFLWAIVMLSFILGVIPCQPSPTGWDLCLQIMGLGLFGGKTIAHQLATN